MDQLIKNRNIKVPDDLDLIIKNKYFLNVDSSLEKEMEYLFIIVEKNWKNNKDNLD